MPKMSILGYELSASKQQDSSPSSEQKNWVRQATEDLKAYKADKEYFEAEIIENEKWWKMQHWDVIRKRNQREGEPEPVSGYLFSTIASKHADAMDNFPAPNMLPREKSDEEEARRLSDIVPVVLERNKYKNTYDSAWWYKLKNGVSCKGVFWNENLENGIGDIDIQKIDLLNVFWEPDITDVQKSKYLFIVSPVDNDVLKESYKDILPQDFSGSRLFDIRSYTKIRGNADSGGSGGSSSGDSNQTNKSLVIDCYYKKNVNGKMQIHLTKFVDEYILGSTEDNPEEYPEGLYDHGMYPIVLDVLFPEEGTPIGFGYTNVVRNPQMYIDKLDQIISKNALISGKQRLLYKESGGVNPDDLMDYSKDAIPCTGGVGEDNFRFIQAEPLNPFIVQHRQSKISELKETSGANDFNRGEGGGGITAASAIMALQEAGNKTSRDMIQASYTAFEQECNMVVALIAQFYTEDRKFRIDGKNGAEPEYIDYNNEKLQAQQLSTMYQGEDPKYRKPIFDIKVRPEKQNPFSQMAHNELAKELFAAGMFNPELSTQALVALEMMQFEGKDKIIQKIQENATLMQQMQQMQQQMQQQQQQQMQMAAMIQQLTGRDMGATDLLLKQKSEEERLAKSIGQSAV